MIFVVEDERVIRRSLVEFFTTIGHQVEGFETAEAALAAAKQSTPDLVVTDVQLPGMNGLDLLRELAVVEPGIIRIVMTAHTSVQTALTAMRNGAYEYLEKPLDLEKLRRVVERAFGERRSFVELSWVRSAQSDAAREILGESPSVVELRKQIAILGEHGTQAPPVFISGETGVGKGLVARAIHNARFGTNAPWIEVNCAALPTNLVEAELFGYERSAFTDAKQAKPGLFEAATNGTIFLDEIGEISLEVQSKLLKVLESGTVRRLGSVRDRAFSCATISASNVDLREAVRDGSFRADLYHRLAAFTIDVPPLRERGEDILLLARAFLHQLAARYRKPLRDLTLSAGTKLLTGRWPGNVRELRFAIERAVILAPRNAEFLGDESLQVDVDASILPPASTSALPTGRDAVVPSQGAPTFPAQAPPFGATIDGTMEDVFVVLPDAGIDFDRIERAVLKAALVKTSGNVAAAARLLGLQRDAMRYRIKRHGLET